MDMERGAPRSLCWYRWDVHWASGQRGEERNGMGWERRGRDEIGWDEMKGREAPKSSQGGELLGTASAPSPFPFHDRCLLAAQGRKALLKEEHI